MEQPIALLVIAPEHTLLVERLPFHHRDPFDRLLVPQALHEGLVIATRDPRFESYGVTRLWSG